MKTEFKQSEILKENIKILCAERSENFGALRHKLELPNNYLTALGLVRIADYFQVSIVSLLEQ